MHYKILKEFGDFKEGEVFARSSYDGTDVEISALIEEGTIALIEESAPETVPMKEMGDFSYNGMKIVTPIEEEMIGEKLYKKFTVENGQSFKVSVDSADHDNIVDLRGGGGGKVSPL